MSAAFAVGVFEARTRGIYRLGLTASQVAYVALSAAGLLDTESSCVSECFGRCACGDAHWRPISSKPREPTHSTRFKVLSC